MTVLGRIADASNVTVLARIEHAGRQLHAVYKPVRGERPLWDFPGGTLAGREVAAYRLSRLCGLDVVPVTVLREGPLGTGSVQRWVGDLPGDGGVLEREPGAGVIDLYPPSRVPPGWLIAFRGEDPAGGEVVLSHAPDPALAALVIFDALANNADRKCGHVLRDNDSRLFGIDNGLTFHEEPKLRTVLWGWAGEPIPAPLCEAVSAVADHPGLYARLHGKDREELISEVEVRAVRLRAGRILRRGRFPRPRGSWPQTPWPPF